MGLGLLVLVFEEEEALGLERERSVLTKDEFVLDSKALFQNPKSISSSLLLFQLLDVGLVLGGVICKDKSGCAGNSSILSSTNYLSMYVSVCMINMCKYFCFSSCVPSSSSLLLLVPRSSFT